MLISKIRDDSLVARKQKDSVKAALLTTLVSEISLVGKNQGNRESTDAEAVVVLKKTLKGVEETIAILEKTAPADSRLASALLERDWINGYLPSQMTEDEISSVVDDMVKGLSPEQKTPKAMSQVMASLKSLHGGRYDGAVASRIIKAKLAV